MGKVHKTKKPTLQYMKDYYDRLYHERKERAMRPLSAYKVFLGYLKVSGGRLLDIGCGTGYLLKQAEQKGLVTYGIDVSEEAVSVAKMGATKSEVIVADAAHLPFEDQFFDYITVIGTLEHFLRPDVALEEMHRVCKRNGRLCIVVPNSHYLFDIIGVLRHGYSHAGTEQPYEKLATLNEWRDFLAGAGFTVSKVFQDKGPPIEPIFKVMFENKNPRYIIWVSLSRLLRALMPLALTYQFVFILGKRGKVG